MTKEEFIEIENQNKYINDLLKKHQKDIQQKLESFFDGLSEEIGGYGFTVCVHTHTDRINISVYDGTKGHSQHLTIESFEVVKKTDNFNPLVLDLVEIWLRDLK